MFDNIFEFEEDTPPESKAPPESQTPPPNASETLNFIDSKPIASSLFMNHPKIFSLLEDPKDLEKFKEKFKENSDETFEGITLPMKAAEVGNIDALEFMRSNKGIEYIKSTSNGFDALFFAIKSNKLDTLKYLVNEINFELSRYYKCNLCVHYNIMETAIYFGCCKEIIDFIFELKVDFYMKVETDLFEYFDSNGSYRLNDLGCLERNDDEKSFDHGGI